MPVIKHLQHAIETLHDVQTLLDIDAYLVDDDMRRQLPGAREGVPEQLFICETGDSVDVALYIDPMIVSLLEADQPQLHLHPGNLEHTCIALEGVSHFVFFTWCADVGRAVTALELELQAEVDKFVLAWVWLREQGIPYASSSKVLLKQLFQAFTLHEGMSAEEESRYRAANQAAFHYCRSLVRRFGRDTNATRIRGDVRAFHRQSLMEKMRAA